MANYQLLSLSSSPTGQVLLKDMSLDPLLYNLQSSLPSMTKDKIQLPVTSNFAYGKKFDFALPRYGLLAGIVLKTNLKLLETTSVLTRNASFVLVKSARIMSHSREISSLNYVQNYCMVSEQETSVKDTLRRVGLSDLSTGVAIAATNAGDVNMYTPIMFAETTSGLGNLIDLSFVEPITVSIELCSALEISRNSATAPVINTSDCGLIVYYYSLDEASLRKYQDMQFDLSKPLSCLSYSTYEESIVEVSITSAATTGKFSGSALSQTLKFNVPNLVTCTRIAVVPEFDRGRFQPITAAEFFMNGRSVYKYSDNLETALENALFSVGGTNFTRSVNGSSVGESAGGQDENVLSHYWNIQPDSKNMFSGGCSGKNVSNWSCNITMAPYAATASTAYKFYIIVVHEYINIISYSGNSGKIAVSMSL